MKITNKQPNRKVHWVSDTAIAEAKHYYIQIADESGAKVWKRVSEEDYIKADAMVWRDRKCKWK
ncbi:MAG: hypothetical protein IKU30_01085 [Clostridia bacterium]|nr:hypothetical protein [Clostridia bacterium]